MNISAISIGIVAVRALRGGASGVVRSVFERSFYVTLGETWICVGPPGLGEGPLNLLCAPVNRFFPAQAGIQKPCALSPLGPRLRGDERKGGRLETNGMDLREGDAALVHGDVLRLGNALTIALGDAAVWRPSLPGDWSAESLSHGLAAFDAALPAELPREGLALLLRPPSDDTLPPVARAASSPAKILSSLVRSVAVRSRIERENSSPPPPHTPLIPAQAGSQEPRIAPPLDDALDPRLRGDERVQKSEALSSLQSLLGLGPGLTPSGDDFIGGAMVALTGLEMTSLRDALWNALAPLTATHTNDISRAHLAATAEGFGSGTLHGLLEAVMVGDADAIAPCIAALAEVGHTSGWDAMAGAITVLRAAHSA